MYKILGINLFLCHFPVKTNDPVENFQQPTVTDVDANWKPLNAWECVDFPISGWVRLLSSFCLDTSNRMQSLRRWWIHNCYFIDLNLKSAERSENGWWVSCDKIQRHNGSCNKNGKFNAIKCTKWMPITRMNNQKIQFNGVHSGPDLQIGSLLLINVLCYLLGSPSIAWEWMSGKQYANNALNFHRWATIHSIVTHLKTAYRYSSACILHASPSAK